MCTIGVLADGCQRTLSYRLWMKERDGLYFSIMQGGQMHACAARSRKDGREMSRLEIDAKYAFGLDDYCNR